MLAMTGMDRLLAYDGSHRWLAAITWVALIVLLAACQQNGDGGGAPGY